MSTNETVRVPPSTAVTALAVAIVAGIGGYFLGQAKSLGLFGSSSTWPAPGAKIVNSDMSSDDDEEEDVDSDEDAVPKDLSDFKENANEEYKLVLVVRTDLGMTKGKIAAQCSHATLACYKALSRSSIVSENQVLKRWERQGQAKVALQVRSEDELELLQAQAISLGLCAQVVHDAGRTQIAAGSATVLGVGPGPKGIIDQVTGQLKLL
ncbi:MAG: hypothetical protein M4579_005249 [Chaenotheca gracillima]|nr:MAG: hypothetical protein M4579_005249 [Chaenotheca gracillima]